LRNTASSLKTDPRISALSPENQLAELRRRFEDVSRRAALGDQQAVEELPQTSRDFLESSRDFYGQSQEFYDDFNRVQGSLTRAAAVADRQVDIGQQQLDVLNEQLTALREVVAGLQKLGRVGVTDPNAPTRGPGGASNEEIVAFAKRVHDPSDDAGAARKLYDAALATNTPLSRIDEALGLAPGTAEQFAIDQGLPTFASGGLVSGPGTGTSDSITARVSNGEFVTRATATRANRDTLEAINQGANLTGAMQAGVEVNAAGFNGVVAELKLANTRLRDIEDRLETQERNAS